MLTNSTYYDTDDMTHLLERCMAAMRSIPMSGDAGSNHDPILPLDSVQVRYYGTATSATPVHVTTKREYSPSWPKPHNNLYISIGRRQTVFDNQVEMLGSMASATPVLPQSVLQKLALEVCHSLADHSVWAGLRRDYGQQGEQTYGFPARAAERMVAALVVPVVQIRIRERVKSDEKKAADIAKMGDQLRSVEATLDRLRHEKKHLVSLIEGVIEKTTYHEARREKYVQRLQKLLSGKVVADTEASGTDDTEVSDND